MRCNLAELRGLASPALALAARLCHASLMSQRPPRTTLERVSAAIAAPGTLLMVLAFFMPWYSVTCGGMTLATGTGYDIATRGLHAPRTDRAPAFGEAGHIPPPPNALGPASAETTPNRDAWLVLLPLCALVAFGGFALAWTASSPRIGLLVAGAAAFGGVLVPIVHALVLRGRLHDAVSARTGADPMQRNVSLALEQSVVTHLENGWYLAVFGGLLAAGAAGAWWLAAAGRRTD